MNIRQELIALEVKRLSDPLMSDQDELERFRVISRLAIYGSCEEMERFHLEHSGKTAPEVSVAMDDYQGIRGVAA